MDWFSDRVVDLSFFTRNHLPLISLMFSAVFAVYLGKPALAWGTSWLKNFSPALRIPVKAALVMATLGLVFYYLPEWLISLFYLFNDITLAPVIIATFLLIGTFIDRSD